MRTWDRIRLNEWHPVAPSFEFERDPVVIIADEISEMIRQGMTPMYPVCAPPFDDFIIDMRPSPWPFMLQQGFSESVQAISVSFTVVKDDRYLTHIINEVLGGGLFEQAKDQAKDQVEELRNIGAWVIGAMVFADFPRGVAPIAWVALCVLPNGELYETVFVKSYISGRELMFGDDDPETIAIEEMVKPALMAVSLINCSNIGMVDTQGDYTRPERRRLKRADKPLFTYNRLQVKPHMTTKSGRKNDDPESVAIHLVRGHFKTYNNEKPLFGKLIGTWWWQPMARGTDKRFVVKDYEVESDI